MHLGVMIVSAHAHSSWHVRGILQHTSSHTDQYLLPPHRARHGHVCRRCCSGRHHGHPGLPCRRERHALPGQAAVQCRRSPQGLSAAGRRERKRSWTRRIPWAVLPDGTCGDCATIRAAAMLLGHKAILSTCNGRKSTALRLQSEPSKHEGHHSDPIAYVNTAASYHLQSE